MDVQDPKVFELPDKGSQSIWRSHVAQAKQLALNKKKRDEAAMMERLYAAILYSKQQPLWDELRPYIIERESSVIVHLPKHDAIAVYLTADRELHAEYPNPGYKILCTGQEFYSLGEALLMADQQYQKHSHLRKPLLRRLLDFFRELT